MNTEIIFILDHSGSMATLASSVISGTNKFVADQRELPGQARFTLVKFSSPEKFSAVHEAVPLEQVPVMDSFRPLGMTALYDAIGKTLTQQGKRIAEEGWADKVIVAIMTDGEENASVRYSRGEVKEMIEHAQSHGWDFIFLGANINVNEYVADLGINPQNAYAFVASAAGTTLGYSNMSTRTAELRGVTY